MSWRPRFHHLRHPKRIRQRVKQPREFVYFQAAQWATLPEVFLVVAISKLGQQERMMVGPARVRYRNKRLRAVEIYRKRFGKLRLKDLSMPRLPRWL